MSLTVGIGVAHALDAREAGMQATHQALNQMGSISPGLAILVSPHRFDGQMVVSGVASLLSNVPVIGFSSSATLTNQGYKAHAVVVVLLGGEDFQAETHWFANYSQESAETAARVRQLLGYEQRPAESILAFADGLNGNTEEFCQGLAAQTPLMGALAAGDPQNNFSYQIAGAQSGSDGMATAFLRGKIKTAVGYQHGWQPVGNHFRVTRSRGFWLRTLDGRPASEAYASLFGHPPRDWAFPPLNYMTRIYPLGYEQSDSNELVVRAPLRVEADGSFRLNAPLRDGADVYLMMASPSACEAAARQAAQQAVLALDGAKPIFGLVLVDSAWQMILQARPGAEIRALQEILGEELPLAGGYTLGQIVPPRAGQDETSRFLNQHMLVILFGDPQEK